MPQLPDLSEPSLPGIEPERLAELRIRAASRLPGAAGNKGSTARAADALTVLHALASSPATAPDALALLHELQVHQVELDLQAQELRESRAELEAALRRQIELYDFQPVGHFTIDPQLLLHELNQTGADMLGIGREDAYGLTLDAFLGAKGAQQCRSAMARVDAGVQRPSCLPMLRPRRGPERQTHARFSRDPAANRYLVSVSHTDDEQPPQADAS
jgi:PAS domain-containing protein